VTSDQLYALGIELMDKADGSGRICKADAFQYRDGLIIALLAVVPLRRRTAAALRIGENLVKSGDLWVLVIPAKDTKTRCTLEYPLSEQLSARIDIYLDKFRGKIPGTASHAGLWPSNLGSSMDGGGIYEVVRRRTRSAFGFAINLHRFRHAAATFWSCRDPKNVRGAKDLLGQSSFGTTEKHYIRSRALRVALSLGPSERDGCRGAQPALLAAPRGGLGRRRCRLTGSNPVGRANNFNNLRGARRSKPKIKTVFRTANFSPGRWFAPVT
jgi:integrase